VLFDVDGVLLDSGAAHRDVWHGWARHHGLDPAAVHAATQGRRRVDILRQLAPGHSPEVENRLLDTLMAERESVITAYAGAAHLLASLPRRALVTSSRAKSVLARFHMLGLPVPEVRICAEDVPEGKPSPAGYLAAAAGLGVDPTECLVIEDAPAGIEAGRAAGCTVYAVATTHAPEALSNAHAVFATLQDLTDHLTERVRTMSSHQEADDLETATSLVDSLVAWTATRLDEARTNAPAEVGQWQAELSRYESVARDLTTMSSDEVRSTIQELTPEARRAFNEPV
jgi:sugar-phosphatase